MSGTETKCAVNEINNLVVNEYSILNNVSPRFGFAVIK